jgi:hypothetical protein
MQVNSVEDLDSFSAPAAGGGGAAAETATATPTPTTTAPAPTPAAENPPKQSTIKIQSPPSKETKKDDSITVAMRQAGEQAASKAKDGNKDTTAKPESDSEKPQEGVNTEQKESEPESGPKAEQAGGAETHTEEQKQKQEEKQEEKEENKTQDPKNVGPRPRRKSATPAPELAGNGAQRPPLATVPEGAAESSENIQADNAEALGLVEHHRGSIVSATSDEERSQVARDLRQSVSESRADAVEAQEEGCSLIEDEDGDGGGMDVCIPASVCC